jgi:hypothetical protein
MENESSSTSSLFQSPSSLVFTAKYAFTAYHILSQAMSQYLKNPTIRFDRAKANKVQKIMETLYSLIQSKCEKDNAPLLLEQRDWIDAVEFIPDVDDSAHFRRLVILSLMIAKEYGKTEKQKMDVEELIKSLDQE